MQQTGIFIEPPGAIIYGDTARQEAFRQRLLKLQQPVASLSPVSLQEMGKVRLMNRTDLKYMVSEKIIPLLLESLADNYCIQEVEGKRVAEYETQYLDTEDLIFFHTHVNGKLNRFKWRVRTYLDSDLTFLEMKFKSNTGRTEKKRIPYNALIGLIDSSVSDFIAQNSGISSENLSPVLQNNFNRITLVNIGKTERLTIDLNITYRNSVNGVQVSLNNLAIIELKQDRTIKSTASEIIKGMRIKQTGVSKYCLGMALTSPLVKGNIYKQKIRQITKILNQQ